LLGEGEVEIDETKMKRQRTWMAILKFEVKYLFCLLKTKSRKHAIRGNAVIL
jgi:hypothetical protein